MKFFLGVSLLKLYLFEPCLIIVKILFGITVKIKCGKLLRVAVDYVVIRKALRKLPVACKCVTHVNVSFC